MKIEDLTKTQLILLAVLISFITSIVTGIVTVTLLEQSPPALTQTINRVVEKTVQTVVPGKTEKVEIPVSIDEESLVVKAIEQAMPAVIAGGDGAAFYISPNRLVSLSLASSSPIVNVNFSYATSSAHLVLADSGPRVGQRAIAVAPGGEIAAGIVTSYLEDDQLFQTEIRSSITGSPIINIYGEVIGAYLSAGRVLPVETIKAAIDAANKID